MITSILSTFYLHLGKFKFYLLLCLDDFTIYGKFLVQVIEKLDFLLNIYGFLAILNYCIVNVTNFLLS